MLKYKKLSRYASAPIKASPNAAGFDLCSSRHYKISPQNVEIIKTDIRVQLPEGCYGRIAPRSGLAIKCHIGVGAGVIDPDFRGNLSVVLFNHHRTEPFVVHPGDRIAQLICEKFASPDPVECENLGETERGEAGFGSTGVSILLPQPSTTTTTTTTPLAAASASLAEEEVSGFISWQEAESILNEEKCGTFLVRICEHVWGYAISYKDAVGVKHYLIDASNGHYKVLGTDHISHKTLGDLISYYKIKPLTSNSEEILKFPCLRSRDLSTILIKSVS